VRLEQVLVNLIRHATDATAEAPAAESSTVRVSVEPIEKWVRITVRDFGPGIPADVLPRLFEPFFTTKEIGQGLGLGLAISTSIARDFGGSLSAANMPGGGAQFTLTLVRADVTSAATT
ncbi:sensor histidine kinase, partial [Streptomyces sp. IF17]|nr:sensor histidine kinase [Streptomyces alkaliphilus]